MTIENVLTGKLEFDEFYNVGDVILLEYDATDGQADYGMARGHYRLNLQMILIGLYALLLLLVGGITGAKALLSFVLTAISPCLCFSWPNGSGVGAAVSPALNDQNKGRHLDPGQKFCFGKSQNTCYCSIFCDSSKPADTFDSGKFQGCNGCSSHATKYTTSGAHDEFTGDQKIYS